MRDSKLTLAVAFTTLLVACAVALVSDDPAPPLALIGALVLAMITAEAAAGRQARQLAADGGRQAAALDHDRNLEDLRDLRGILDEAAVALHRGDEAIGGVEVAYTQYGTALDERAPDARRELAHHSETLDALTARLSVRLGRDATAAQALRGAADAALLVHRETGWLHDDAPLDAQRRDAAIAAAREAFREAADRFVATAVGLAGAQIAIEQDGSGAAGPAPPS